MLSNNRCNIIMYHLWSIYFDLRCWFPNRISLVVHKFVRVSKDIQLVTATCPFIHNYLQSHSRDHAVNNVKATYVLNRWNMQGNIMFHASSITQSASWIKKQIDSPWAPGTLEAQVRAVRQDRLSTTNMTMSRKLAWGELLVWAIMAGEWDWSMEARR